MIDSLYFERFYMPHTLTTVLTISNPVSSCIPVLEEILSYHNLLPNSFGISGDRPSDFDLIVERVT